MSKRSPAAPDLSWVYISGAAFVSTLLAAGLFITFGRELTFISNAVYYILLIPIALAAAAFLFGAMRSHARYKGNAGGGTLQLSGPVVVFSLVLLGGLKLANPDATGSLTIRLHGPEGPEQLITEGEVVLDVGDDRRTRAIGADGQVTFTQVPVHFLSGQVGVIARVPRHRAKHAGPYRVPPSRVIALELERLPDSTTVAGSVFDAAGPIERAVVNVGHGLVTAVTDANGNFRIVVPLEAGRIAPVTVTLDGRTLYDESFVVATEPGLRIAVPSRDR